MSGDQIIFFIELGLNCLVRSNPRSVSSYRFFIRSDFEPSSAQIRLTRNWIELRMVLVFFCRDTPIHSLIFITNLYYSSIFSLSTLLLLLSHSCRCSNLSSLSSFGSTFLDFVIVNSCDSEVFEYVLHAACLCSSSVVPFLYLSLLRLLVIS